MSLDKKVMAVQGLLRSIAKIEAEIWEVRDLLDKEIGWVMLEDLANAAIVLGSRSEFLRLHVKQVSEIASRENILSPGQKPNA